MGPAIARTAARLADIFYVFERAGAHVPDGPVLTVANHPNSLLDPISVYRVAGRPVRPLAKEPLFHYPILGSLLRSLGGLPVYRKQDHPGEMHRNEQTFDAAVAALRAGDAVQIYPEGKSHDEPALAPLRTGAARIALRAEAESGWALGLRIAPIGLTYPRKTTFRGRALALVGEPFGITHHRGAYESDPVEAVRALTDEIADRIEAVTLNLSAREDFALLDAAERIYAREKGLAGWRERDPLSERLPRLQAFARGLAWLRAHDPPRHERLASRVRRYRALSAALGAGDDADVPPRYARGDVARYLLRRIVPLVLLAPLALIGAAAFVVPFFIPRLVARAVRADITGEASIKLSAGAIVMPLAWAAWVALAWRSFGLVPAVFVALALPPLALIAILWLDLLRTVREDAGLYLRVASTPKRLERLARRRRALVAEFEEIAAIERAYSSTSSQA